MENEKHVTEQLLSQYKKIKGEIKEQSPKSAEEGNKDQSRNECNRD